MSTIELIVVAKQLGISLPGCLNRSSSSSDLHGIQFKILFELISLKKFQKLSFSQRLNRWIEWLKLAQKALKTPQLSWGS